MAAGHAGAPATTPAAACAARRARCTSFPLLPVIPRQTPGLPPSLPFRTTPPPKPAPISPPFPRFPQFPHRLSRPVEDREGCPALAGVRNLCLDDPSAGRPDRHCNFSDRSIQARRATAARSASPSNRPYRRHCSAPTSWQAPVSADQRSVDAAFMPGSLRRRRCRSPGRCCPRRGRSWPGGPSRGGSSRRSSVRGRVPGRCAGPPAGSGRRRRPRRGAAACPSRADWESQRILICDQADNGVTRFDMINNTKTGSLEAECL